MNRQILAAVLLTFVTCSSRLTQGASFQGLPFIFGQSSAESVTADGTIAVGYTETQQPPYYESGAEWTNGTLSSQLNNFADNGAMIGQLISGDGSTIEGTGISNSIPLQPVVEKGGNLAPLGALAGTTTSPSGISYDGSVIVGRSINTSNHTTEPFYWHNGVMTGLGFLPGSAFFSVAEGVSADGTVVVGQSDSAQAAGYTQGFRWVSDGMGGGTMTPLPLFPGQNSAITLAVSANGNVAVGAGGNNGSSLESLMWNGNSITSLGILPGFTSTQATVVSGDGSIVAGWNFVGLSDTGRQAYLWTEATGMVSLKSYLVANGATGLTGWTLSWPNAISADGRTIVGYGYNPQGGLQAFSATIPEPSSIVLLAIGALGLAILARRASIKPPDRMLSVGYSPRRRSF